MPDVDISTRPPGYEVHTPVFEGPLALLLRLIEKRELDITKVALAQVTDEFMVHVERLRETMQIELIAEFLSVAAKLLWIKSRALLPKPPASANLVVDEEDVGDELIRQLRAYRQYKEAAGWLRERDHAGLRAYIRTSTSPRPKTVTLLMSGVQIADLQATAEASLYPTETPPPEGAIQRVRISITDQITLIRRRLTNWAKITFKRLLTPKPSRLEAVVTLQAILELIKQRSIDASQEEMFGDITVEALVPTDQIRPPGQMSEEVTAA